MVLQPGIVHFQNQSGQTAELPWPIGQRQFRREPCHIVPATERALRPPHPVSQHLLPFVQYHPAEVRHRLLHQIVLRANDIGRGHPPRLWKILVHGKCRTGRQRPYIQRRPAASVRSQHQRIQIVPVIAVEPRHPGRPAALQQHHSPLHIRTVSGDQPAVRRHPRSRIPQPGISVAAFDPCRPDTVHPVSRRLEHHLYRLAPAVCRRKYHRQQASERPCRSIKDCKRDFSHIIIRF